MVMQRYTTLLQDCSKKVKFFFPKEIKLKNENVKIYYLFYFFQKKGNTFLGNIL